MYCYKRIRTNDSNEPSARCFSVQDGLFRHVWTNDDVISQRAPEFEMLDGYVIPGLWDGHGHLLQYGQFLHSVDLFGSQSLDDVRDRVKKYLSANPGAGNKDEWIRGVGWDQAAFGRMPTAVSLPYLSKDIKSDRLVTSNDMLMGGA